MVPYFIRVRTSVLGSHRLVKSPYYGRGRLPPANHAARSDINLWRRSRDDVHVHHFDGRGKCSYLRDNGDSVHRRIRYEKQHPQFPSADPRTSSREFCHWMTVMTQLTTVPSLTSAFVLN